jgi:hypothetical protein
MQSAPITGCVAAPYQTLLPLYPCGYPLSTGAYSCVSNLSSCLVSPNRYSLWVVSAECTSPTCLPATRGEFFKLYHPSRTADVIHYPSGDRNASRLSLANLPASTSTGWEVSEEPSGYYYDGRTEANVLTIQCGGAMCANGFFDLELEYIDRTQGYLANLDSRLLSGIAVYGGSCHSSASCGLGKGLPRRATLRGAGSRKSTVKPVKLNYGGRYSFSPSCVIQRVSARDKRTVRRERSIVRLNATDCENVATRLLLANGTSYAQGQALRYAVVEANCSVLPADPGILVSAKSLDTSPQLESAWFDTWEGARAVSTGAQLFMQMYTGTMTFFTPRGSVPLRDEVVVVPLGNSPIRDALYEILEYDSVLESGDATLSPHWSTVFGHPGLTEPDLSTARRLGDRYYDVINKVWKACDFPNMSEIGKVATCASVRLLSGAGGRATAVADCVKEALPKHAKSPLLSALFRGWPECVETAIETCVDELSSVMEAPSSNAYAASIQYLACIKASGASCCLNIAIEEVWEFTVESLAVASRCAHMACSCQHPNQCCTIAMCQFFNANCQSDSGFMRGWPSQKIAGCPSEGIPSAYCPACSYNYEAPEFGRELQCTCFSATDALGRAPKVVASTPFPGQSGAGSGVYIMCGDITVTSVPASVPDRCRAKGREAWAKVRAALELDDSRVLLNAKVRRFLARNAINSHVLEISTGDRQDDGTGKIEALNMITLRCVDHLFISGTPGEADNMCKDCFYQCCLGVFDNLNPPADDGVPDQACSVLADKSAIIDTREMRLTSGS